MMLIFRYDNLSLGPGYGLIRKLNPLLFMKRTLLVLVIATPLFQLNASDATRYKEELQEAVEVKLVGLQPEGATTFKAQLLNTTWSWIHAGQEITFRDNGQAWVNGDREVKNWFVADKAGRVVAGTFAGSRTFMFTFSPDLKTAKAILDGDRVWEARRMK